jgi:hypothetical protein
MFSRQLLFRVMAGAVLANAIVPGAARAQIIRSPGPSTATPARTPASPSAPASASTVPDSFPPPDQSTGQRAQADFEEFRRLHLPAAHSRAPSTCDEQVGRFCYWYDDREPAPPKEPPAITQRREQLIALLDTIARVAVDDRWVSGQRVRYLAESERYGAALDAAKQCRVGGWWCDILVGFSLHLLGRYQAADSVYAVALKSMQSRDRCDWRSVDLLIDDDARQQYRRFPCGDARREAFEDRAWFFARTLYSMDGNDSRTEHYARMTMTLMLRDAPGIYENGFDDDERELLLRFGWPRAWAMDQGGLRMSQPQIMLPGGMGPRGGGGMGRPGGIPRPRGTGGGPRPDGRGGPRPDGRGGPGQGSPAGSVIGMEPMPAYRYVPPGFVLNNPSISDSSAWRLQLPPVIARYAPPYAVTLKPLEHQKAMFRRGDTALVVLAYDTRSMKELDSARISAALVITPSDSPRDYAVRVSTAPAVGVLTARAPWGPLLMSAEVAAPDRRAVARARYGVAMPFAVGARVTLSDLLLYKPHGSFPQSVEEAAPHAIPTERLRADEKLGVYWESYGTDPAGEKMHVSLTVVREVEESGFFRRQAKALKLVHEATPVTVSVEDLSARGTRVSPRAIEVDISTLRKGSYIVQLEIEVAGQYVVRADHRIEVVAP